MSTGGIFTLISNDGKQDRMLMATQLLNTRLVEIRKLRAKAGLRDPTPTLVDIERTHLLFVNSHFKPFAAIGFEYNKVKPTQGSCTFGSSLRFSIPQFGDFFHDMVFHIKIGSTSVLNTGDRFFYSNFLGHRLLKRVAFSVNGNPLDEYDSDVYNMHFNFFVTSNKEVGWKRNVGQEQCLEGHLFIEDLDIRECRDYKEGPQTPKGTHNAIDMWIPLLFWFNKDPRLAIPSVSIPYGQRFIDIDLATLAEITCFQDDGSSTGIGETFTPPTIDECELYINNIFVNPEIHDIFIKRIGFNLIRVHRRQDKRLSAANGTVLLNQMKWPLETMYVGARPITNLNECDQWNIFAQVTNQDVCVPAVIESPNPPGPPTKQLVVRVAQYQRCTPTLTTIGVEAHSIALYPEIPAQFFNSYIPYTYGGANIKTPTDCGALMIVFNLYPGSFQPSGHINVSRAREFFFKYTSSFISSSNQTDLVVVGIAINFLLISDGSAVLRYST